MKLRYPMLFIVFILVTSCHRDYKNPFDTKVTLHDISNFQAMVKGESIELSWTINDQIKTGYLIEKRSSLNQSGEFITIEDPSQTFYGDTVITTDILYTYRILGISDENQTAYTNTISISVGFPSPYNLLIEALSDTSAQISWCDTCAFEHGFVIERKLAGNNEWEVIEQTGQDVTYMIDKNLNINNTYFYRIFGFTENNQSAPSTESSAIATFEAPLDLKILSSFDNGIYLSWTDNCSFESGYIAQWVIEGQTDTTTQILNPNIEQIEIENLNQENHYHIEIYAYTPNNRSEPLTGKLSFIQDFQWYRTLSGQTQTISSLCFFQNDQYLVTGSHDNTVRIWSTENWNLINTAPGDAQDNGNQVVSIAFVPTHDLAIGNQNGSLSIWNVFEWNQTSYLNPNSYIIYDIFVSNETRSIFAAKYKYIYIWSTESWEYQGSLSDHTGNIFTLALAPVKQLFVSGGEDDLIHIWALDQRSHIQNVKGHGGDITALCFSQDETLLASGSLDRTIKIWSTETWQENRSLPVSDIPKDLLFSPDGNWLISALISLSVWSTSTWQETILLDNKNTASITSLAVSQNGQWLAAGNDQGEIFILNTTDQWQIN